VSRVDIDVPSFSVSYHGCGRGGEIAKRCGQRGAQPIYLLGQRATCHLPLGGTISELADVCPRRDAALGMHRDRRPCLA